MNEVSMQYMKDLIESAINNLNSIADDLIGLDVLDQDEGNVLVKLTEKACSDIVFVQQGINHYLASTKQ